jgi:hypothetical protein
LLNFCYNELVVVSHIHNTGLSLYFILVERASGTHYPLMNEWDVVQLFVHPSSKRENRAPQWVFQQKCSYQS